MDHRTNWLMTLHPRFGSNMIHKPFGPVQRMVKTQQLYTTELISGDYAHRPIHKVIVNYFVRRRYLGPRIKSNMVHKPLTPLSKWVQILDFSITMDNYQYKESIIDMPAKLSTTVNKIQLIPNSTNAGIISEFYVYGLVV